MLDFMEQMDRRLPVLNLSLRAIPWRYDDGGRAAAGFKGNAPGDCVARAIAIACRMPYGDAYALINETARRESPRTGNMRSSARKGVSKSSTRSIMQSLGWKFVPTMGIGTGCTVHLRLGELPMGRIIVQLSRHVAAVIDGTLHDNHDSSRGGTRCVYGYYVREATHA